MPKQPEARKTDQPLALSSSAVLGPLLPTRRGQAEAMTLTGSWIATEERGHWYSPAAVRNMLSAGRRPQTLKIKELQGQKRRLEDMLFAAGRMEEAPCFVCGYNGPGYYQPEQHKCAARHHKLRLRA